MHPNRATHGALLAIKPRQSMVGIEVLTIGLHDTFEPGFRSRPISGDGGAQTAAPGASAVLRLHRRFPLPPSHDLLRFRRSGDVAEHMASPVAEFESARWVADRVLGSVLLAVLDATPGEARTLLDAVEALKRSGHGGQ